MKFFRKATYLCLLSAIFTISFQANSVEASPGNPIAIGSFGKWASYYYESDNDGKVCYMISQPEKAEGDYTARGDIFAIISHRTGDNTKNEFSYMTGYPYKANSTVDIKIGSEKFKLFTQGEQAWAYDSQTDNNLADAIRKGSKMIVKGTSSRGTLTTDTFSLSGSMDAHKAISAECGM